MSTETDLSGTTTLTTDEQTFFDSRGEDGGDTNNEGDRADEGASSEGDQSEGGGERQQDADRGEGQDGKQKTTVPHGAMHEERQRRKAAEKRAGDFERENIAFRERFKILNDHLGSETEKKPPASAEDDLFGSINHVMKTVGDLDKRLSQQDQQRTQQAAQARFINDYKADAEAFKKTTADFDDAYQFLLTSRVKELQAIGYEHPEDLQKALLNEEAQIAQAAFSRGTSPAQMIYDLATGRGYVKKAAAAAQDSEKRLDTIERGQQANRSLSSTGASNGDADMTAERLLSMRLDDFEKWIKSNPAKARRLMGG